MAKFDQLQSPTDEQANRPRDCNGTVLSAFDIVRIMYLPDYIFADADTQELRDTYKGYEHCYAIIKYARYPDQDGWRRWYGNNGLILVEATKATELFITVYEFVIPPQCVERLPFNSVIMNLFVNFDWQIHWDASTVGKKQEWDIHHPDKVIMPIKKGTAPYNRLNAIINTPYDELILAHCAAEHIIPALSS